MATVETASVSDAFNKYQRRRSTSTVDTAMLKPKSDARFVEVSMEARVLACPSPTRATAAKPNVLRQAPTSGGTVPAENEMDELRARVKFLEEELKKAQTTSLKSYNRAETAPVTGADAADDESTLPADVREALAEARRDRTHIEKLWKAALVEVGPAKLRELQERDHASRALAMAKIDSRRRSEIWEELLEECGLKTYTAIARSFETMGERDGLPLQARRRLFEASSPMSTSKQTDSSNQTPRTARPSSIGLQASVRSPSWASNSGGASPNITSMTPRSVMSARGTPPYPSGFLVQTPTRPGNAPKASDAHAGCRSSSSPAVGVPQAPPPLPAGTSTGRSASVVRDRIRVLDQQTQHRK